MTRSRYFGLLVCLATSGHAAVRTVPDFPAQLEKARSAFTVDAAGLSGAGAAVITQAVSKARYVLIGEDHLSREIPQFTTAICGVMASGVLDALAVEAGPEAAGLANLYLRRPDRPDRVAAFMRRHPDAIAFQNGRDESDMAAHCAKLAGRNFRLWGLDQEFLGASGYLLEQMRASHPGPVARKAIDDLVLRDQAATAEALRSGSPEKLLMFSVTDRQIADTHEAIRRDGGEKARKLFDALTETRSIYLGQTSDSAASNRARSLLMKQTLLRYMGSARPRARVLFKFGDVHVAKGINALGQRDLGNFVAERADGEGAESLHIVVLGEKGVHALYAGVGRQVRTEPFVLTDEEEYAWIKDALKLRDAGGDGDKWMLIDLRTLRHHALPNASQQWRNAIERYDLLALAPRLTPSTLLGARAP